MKIEEKETIKNFIQTKQDNFYGFDGLNSYPNLCVCDVYQIHKEDLVYAEEKRTISLNIGHYGNKKLNYLLETLFIPNDELSFDLLNEMKQHNVTLELNNNVSNHKPLFYKIINNFFNDKGVNIIRKGIWK